MKILVACEESGTVRDAFIAHGHRAVSCDIIPSRRPGPHIVDDVLNVLGDGWDMMIAFPPCTHLAVSGARWWAGKDPQLQAGALDFVRALMAAPIDRIAIENPIGKISTAIRKPDQIIHPWQFGHGEVKSTCLWLRNLPCLVPTRIVEGRIPRIHQMLPGPDRARDRSVTYQGVADAMASQWGDIV